MTRYYVLVRDPKKYVPRTIKRLRGENAHVLRPAPWRCVFAGTESEAMARMLETANGSLEMNLVAGSALPAGVAGDYEKQAKEALATTA